MKTINNRNTVHLSFLKLILFFQLLLTSVFASAQPDAQQGLIRIFEMDVRPSDSVEWTRMQREELIPVQLEGGLDTVTVWRVTGAGNTYIRHVIVPLSELSELDEASVFEKVLGADAATDLLNRHSALLNGITTKIAVPRPDLGFGTPPEIPSIGVLSTVTVENGRTLEFEEHLKTSVRRELRSSNISSFSVLQVLFGGEHNQYLTFVNFEDRGDVATSSALAWALDSTGVANLVNVANSPISGITRTVLRYDALSASSSE